MTTKIEWATETWNPVTGCTKISEGCQNCYAERMSKRLAGRCGYPGQNPFQVTLHPDKLDQPLKWKKPRMIFVCSMGDLFHKDVPFILVQQILDVVWSNPRHIFMILTKRPERMLQYVEFAKSLNDWSGNQSNLWLGVTAENQARADERIPILLQIPAAKRFVSIEPMLGAVDLSKWIMPRTPFTPDNAPNTWAEYQWPDWVPQEVRSQVEDFWGEHQGHRKPKDWAENAIHNDSPPFGMHMGYRDDRTGETVHGRWVFAWNNIGRLIGDNGEIYYPSIPRAHIFDSTKYYWHDLHWVICGGESGPGARPMHPDWARSLRDQCQTAGVPFFFKQWGEHVSISQMPEDTYRAWDVQHGTEVGWVEDRAIWKVGKKAAGRLLDGREWNEYPGVGA